MLRQSICILSVCFVVLHAGSCLGESRYFLEPDYKKTPQTHLRLLEAIHSGSLHEAKAAAEDVDIRNLIGFDVYLIKVGNRDNLAIVRYFRDVYELGISDLQISVMSGDIKAVSDLLAKDLLPEIDATSPEQLRAASILSTIPVAGDFHSPLRLAIARSDVEMVKLLLERGSRPNETMAHLGSSFLGDDPTPLKEAIRIGSPEIVRLLIEAGAAIEDPTVGCLPVDGASWDIGINVWEATPAEIQKKYDEAVATGKFVRVDIESANQFGPMSKAIAAGRAAVVQVLLEAGADPNVSIGGKTTPLHMAVQTGHPEIVRLLVAAGADVNKPDAEGRLPLSLSHQKGDIADILITAGAKMRLE